MLKTFPLEFVRVALLQTLYKAHIEDDKMFGGENQVNIFSFYEQLKTQEEVDRFVEKYRDLTEQQNKTGLIGNGILVSPENPSITNLYSCLIVPMTFTCSIRTRLADRDEMIQTINNLIEELKGSKVDMAQLECEDDNGNKVYEPFMVGTICHNEGQPLVNVGDYIGKWEDSIQVFNTQTKTTSGSITLSHFSTLGDDLVYSFLYTLNESGYIENSASVTSSTSNYLISTSVNNNVITIDITIQGGAIISPINNATYSVTIQYSTLTTESQTLKQYIATRLSSLSSNGVGNNLTTGDYLYYSQASGNNNLLKVAKKVLSIQDNMTYENHTIEVLEFLALSQEFDGYGATMIASGVFQMTSEDTFTTIPHINKFISVFQLCDGNNRREYFVANCTVDNLQLNASGNLVCRVMGDFTFNTSGWDLEDIWFNADIYYCYVGDTFYFNPQTISVVEGGETKNYFVLNIAIPNVATIPNLLKVKLNATVVYQSGGSQTKTYNDFVELTSTSINHNILFIDIKDLLVTSNTFQLTSINVNSIEIYEGIPNFETISDEQEYPDVIFPPEHTNFEKYKLSMSFDAIRCDEPRTLNGDEYCEISFGGSATLVNESVMLGNDLVKVGIAKNKIVASSDISLNNEIYYLEPLEMPSGSNANTVISQLASNNFLQNTHTDGLSLNLQYSFILDKNIDLLKQWFNYARYGTSSVANNGISPNMIYTINEFWSSWGDVEVNNVQAKIIENISVENTESDTLTIGVNMQIQGDNH